MKKLIILVLIVMQLQGMDSKIFNKNIEWAEKEIRTINKTSMINLAKTVAFYTCNYSLIQKAKRLALEKSKSKFVSKALQNTEFTQKHIKKMSCFGIQLSKEIEQASCNNTAYYNMIIILKDIITEVITINKINLHFERIKSDLSYINKTLTAQDQAHINKLIALLYIPTLYM